MLVSNYGDKRIVK